VNPGGNPYCYQRNMATIKIEQSSSTKHGYKQASVNGRLKMYHTPSSRSQGAMYHNDHAIQAVGRKKQEKAGRLL
jgi:hypothetical protein